MPSPALPISLKFTPSKFTFQECEGGGDCLLRKGALKDSGGKVVVFALLNSFRACWVFTATCDAGDLYC